MKAADGVLTLRVEGVGKRFGRRTIFRDLHARAVAGEVLVVTGPNGSGKSTLLAILAGLVRPSRGTARWTEGERELGREFRRRSLGWVAPDLMLYAELTASENLRFFARVRGLETTAKDHAALLERVGLGRRADDLVGSFSSGMRQRLKYAFALLGSPRALLLDEPTANLDVEGVVMVDGVIRDQRERGLLVLATNEPRETEYGDRCLRLGE
jgi:heme exporter protein A